jgi:hypothetical protein
MPPSKLHDNRLSRILVARSAVNAQRNPGFIRRYPAIVKLWRAHWPEFTPAWLAERAGRTRRPVVAHSRGGPMSNEALQQRLSIHATGGCSKAPASSWSALAGI